MWIYRDILTSFDVLTGLPAKLLQGMRQVGKTSLLEELTKNTACKASLDLLPIRELASSNPELFFKNFTPPVFIDEVQYAPELFPQMKYLIDDYSNVLFNRIKLFRIR
jgi:predicted AAA+ superfamily ATPase